MARFCSNCGKPIEDGCAFCMECGTPVSQDDAIPAAAPAADTGFAPAAPAKPMSKKTKIILAVVAGIAVVLFAVSKIFGGIYSTDSVTERFTEALEAGDFAALSKNAVVSDESIVLTEENTKPLFDLCAQSPSAIKSITSMLETNAELIEEEEDQILSYPYTFNVSNFVLFKKYEVCINTCTVQTEVELKNTAVTINGQSVNAVPGSASDPFGSDFNTGADDSAGAAAGDAGASDGGDYYEDSYLPTRDDIVTSVATHEGLLPGLYEIDCTYTTYFGDTISATQSINVDSTYVSTYPGLYYSSMTIYNPYDYTVTVTGSNGSSCEIMPHCDAYLYPITENTAVTVTCSPDGESIFESSVSAFDSSYHEVYFESCSAYIYNNYRFDIVPVVTNPSGTTYELAPVEASDYSYVTLMPVGSVIAARPADNPAIEVPPLACEGFALEEASSYDIVPYFSLTENEVENFKTYLLGLMNELMAAAIANDFTGFESLPNYDSIYIIKTYVPYYMQNESMKDYKMEYSFEFADTDLTVEYRRVNGSYRAYVRPQFNLTLTFTAPDGTVTTENYTFVETLVYYYNGAWNVAAPN